MASRPALDHIVQRYNLADWRSWENYIREHILPLAECGEHLKNQHSNYPNNPLYSYINDIVTIAGEMTSRVGLYPQSRKCYLNEFLEYAANVTAYYNPHTYFAITIRKITRLHFHMHYGDFSYYQSVLDKLGFQWTLQPCTSGSQYPHAQNWYDLGGFRDWRVIALFRGPEGDRYRLQLPYINHNNQIEVSLLSKATLGTLIILLNETVWDMVVKIPDLSDMFLYGDKPLIYIYKGYIDAIAKTLSTVEIGNLISDTLKAFYEEIKPHSYIDIDRITTLREYVRDSALLRYWYTIPTPTQIIPLVVKYSTPLPGISEMALQIDTCTGYLLRMSYYSIDIDGVFWNVYLDFLMPLVMSGLVELVEADASALAVLNNLSKDISISTAYGAVKKWL